jgi:hypothetical protein
MSCGVREGTDGGTAQGDLFDAELGLAQTPSAGSAPMPLEAPVMRAVPFEGKLLMLLSFGKDGPWRTRRSRNLAEMLRPRAPDQADRGSFSIRAPFEL